MYRINEIFYSIQGEGHRVGTPAVFVRFAGCPVATVCPIICDTEFESGVAMTAAAIADRIHTLMPSPSSVILTGGEPLAQYDLELSRALSRCFIAVETSGAYKRSSGARADYLSISPKVAEHVVARNFPNGANELRYVRRDGQAIPQPSIEAERLFISPEFKGGMLERADLDWCISLVKANPEWRMSLQTHKLIGVR